MKQSFHFLLSLFIATIIYSLFLSSAQRPAFPSANISKKWINKHSTTYGYALSDGASVRYILLRETSGPEFGCGFVCPVGYASAGSCESYLFSIFLSGDYGDPQIVWSANRDRPVRENATLEFSKNGDLVLRDFDGTTVWSTNTSGKSVVGMELNEAATLVLFDDKNKTVWTSMDYPTDSLVAGQTLREGQRLTANVSITNSSQGPFYLTVVSNGIQAFVGSQMYYNDTDHPRTKKPTYVSFNNGILQIIVGSDRKILYSSRANSLQFMRLDYGGRFRIYTWNGTSIEMPWIPIDLNDECSYPSVCGEYGICDNNGECSCPDSKYFKPIEWNPNSGCKPSTALSCESYKTQQFLSLPDVSYFGLDYTIRYGDPDINIMPNSTVETCKQACLANCSCKAAFFQYPPNASYGYCFWPSELYSLQNIPELNHNVSAFIKVQSFPNTNSIFSTINANVSKGKKVRTEIIVTASVGALLAFFLVALCAKRRYSYREDKDDDEFSMLSGQLTRFAFEDLRVSTNDFLRKLGEGGFGSVFEGTLVDGAKIAVKRLDNVGQGKKEFLAEVETLGSIHHLHLVRLVGFCVEKSYRLLIYEYMLNGSLDKWIFYKDHDTVLDWQTRRKIITDIAKGLTYLHEDCRQKIVHLDIKPQNILLDENFKAKVSDFGLAKLIDRDQIEVMTRMRGTPGYLAPEWLTSIITEKVDVFSFGVVVLETICGRRNLDYSKDEDSFHLIGLLQKKRAENKLDDMLDYRCTDMKVYIEDVIMIMHLAMWCIQSDSNRRPLMSIVLKVLDGSVEVETDLDYNFSNPTRYVPQNVNIMVSALPTPSILSGPR